MGLGQAAAAHRDARPHRTAQHPAGEEPLRHRSRAARQAEHRRPPALPDRAHARRHLQQPRGPADGEPREPLRSQCPARVHREGEEPARAEPAHGQPRAVDAQGVHPGDDAQPARRRVDPVRGARLVQPRPERAGEPLEDRARRRRPVAAAPDGDPADAPRPECRLRRPADLRHRRYALVGRLAGLRQRSGVRAGVAHRRERQAEARRSRLDPGGGRGARRPRGGRRELLGGARAPPLALHARAQRGLRPPARDPSGASRTTSSTTMRASSSRR